MNIDDKLRRRVAKIEAVLLSQNPPVRSREQLIAGKDKGTKYTDYKGIGRVLGKTLRDCVAHLDIESWYSVFQQVRWDAQDTGPDTDTIRGNRNA